MSPRPLLLVGTGGLAREVLAAVRALNEVMPACVLTHDDVLGDFATLASGVRLGGGVRVGMGAYLGAAAAVREGCRVGEWSLVGMGSVVLQDVPAFETWWGAPARCQRTDAPAEAASAEGRANGTAQR